MIRAFASKSPSLKEQQWNSLDVLLFKKQNKKKNTCKESLCWQWGLDSTHYFCIVGINGDGPPALQISKALPRFLFLKVDMVIRQSGQRSLETGASGSLQPCRCCPKMETQHVQWASLFLRRMYVHNHKKIPQNKQLSR